MLSFISSKHFFFKSMVCTRLCDKSLDAHLSSSRSGFCLQSAVFKRVHIEVVTIWDAAWCGYMEGNLTGPWRHLCQGTSLLKDPVVSQYFAGHTSSYSINPLWRNQTVPIFLYMPQNLHLWLHCLSLFQIILPIPTVRSIGLNSLFLKFSEEILSLQMLSLSYVQFHSH